MLWLHEFTDVEVCQFSALSDNYGYLLRDKKTGKCTAIDTPDFKTVDETLTAQGWSLDFIWNTHWHWDHTDGNAQLKEKYACKIIGPEKENGRIPEADQLICEGDAVLLGETEAHVIETPGHTTGHLIYYLKEQGIAFVGDTLFALGCGRLFEGTAAQMWSSLQKIRKLPGDTTLFCAHEYTKANADFAVTIDPNNKALQQRQQDIIRLRQEKSPTVPMMLTVEQATNPFLRADVPEVQAALNMAGADSTDVFAEIRRRKDNF